jgi:hypothetical protein
MQEETNLVNVPGFLGSPRGWGGVAAITCSQGACGKQKKLINRRHGRTGELGVDSFSTFIVLWRTAGALACQLQALTVLPNMVIGLLAITAIPTVIGVGQAVSAQKKANAASKEQEKFHMSGMLPTSKGFEESGFLVLVDGQVRVSPRVVSLKTQGDETTLLRTTG